MRIVITGPAGVYDLDDNDITDETRLAEIGGLKYDEETCSKYFDESLDEIGISGGAIQIVFDAAAKSLKVVTEYQSPRNLTDDELSLLVKETTGQWSDGLGEGCFDEYADEHDIQIDLWPLGAGDDEVRVEQIDDGTKPKPKRKSPLFNAVKKGDLAKIAKVLDDGGEINPIDRYGATPLHIACRDGQTEIAALLIERGADVDRFDETGWTPLTTASTNGHVGIARLLLENGADVNRQLIDDTGSQQGYSALMMACNRKQFEVGRSLLEYDADVNIRDYSGYSPLLYLDPGDVEFARLLVARGADLDATNEFDEGVDEVLKKKLRSDA